MMNADEIVKALREAPNYNAGTGTSTIEDEAADYIEALQAVGSASYWKSAWETQCAENKKLYEALTESQRRERAAVEIVRCKDCRFRDKQLCRASKSIHYDLHKEKHTYKTFMEPDGFCSIGERGPVAGEGADK
jgi:hypothetical protein